jgi:histone deacetylase complex regulatory component SIN3
MSTLSDPLVNDDQPVDTKRANKRAELTSIKNDVGMFRNVRLSHNELPMEPLEPSNSSYPSGSDRDKLLDISGPSEHGGDEISVLAARDPVSFDNALAYINKVINQFASQPDIYEQFLKILQEYHRGLKST